MASSWGDSWGVAWASSWDIPTPAPTTLLPAAATSGIAGDTPRTKGGSRRPSIRRPGFVKPALGSGVGSLDLSGEGRTFAAAPALGFAVLASEPTLSGRAVAVAPAFAAGFAAIDFAFSGLGMADQRKAKSRVPAWLWRELGLGEFGE